MLSGSERRDREGKRGWSSRPEVLLALVALAVLLTWLLWPVRIILEGTGTIQPRFENLVRVTPGESGMVCRVMAERLAQVQAGEPLFEYIPAGKFSVLTYASMIPPGGAVPEPNPPPAWYQKVERDRIARIEAANHWSSRVLSRGSEAPKWEHDLAQRLTMTVPREADLMLAQAQQSENTRLGRENANKVYTFNEALGETVATERGIPLASPTTGTVYSLWVQARMQIFGAPAGTLPTPVPGGPPVIALHASGSSPVAEIMPPGTPLEVLALVPVPPCSLHRQEGWQASLVREGTGVAVPAGVTKVEVGRVSLTPADAGLLVPELAAGQDSVFVRVSLLDGDPEMMGTTVRVRLVSPSRPRAWLWLEGTRMCKSPSH